VTSIAPNSGGTSGGTVVTISGTGFAAGASVSFGGTAASAVTVNGASTITATAPARGAGSVDLVVSNPDGQSGRLTNGFSYVGSAPPPPPPPAAVAPTLTGVSPGSATTAGGTAVTITGTGFAAGATVSFGSAAASSVSVASATSITATTPAGAAGAVEVTVRNADGLTGRLASGFTYTAPAPPPPPPPSSVVITITPAGVSPSDITIAPGTRVRFVNNDVLPHQIGSDPHPEHTLCPPINDVGMLLPGQSRETAVFTVIRSCGYHDHNDPDNPRWTGTIQVR
jgi:plastocyanin